MKRAIFPDEDSIHSLDENDPEAEVWWDIRRSASLQPLSKAPCTVEKKDLCVASPANNTCKGFEVEPFNGKGSARLSMSYPEQPLAT